MDMLMCAEAHVEAMVERGEAFEKIEEYIDAVMGLDDDQRSALWLLAWAEVGLDARRRVVLDLAS